MPQEETQGLIKIITERRGLPWWLSTICNAGDPNLILGQEDLLEKKTATHSSILAWEIHGQRSLAGYSPWDPKSQIQLSD